MITKSKLLNTTGNVLQKPISGTVLKLTKKGGNTVSTSLHSNGVMTVTDHTLNKIMKMNNGASKLSATSINVADTVISSPTYAVKSSMDIPNRIVSKFKKLTQYFSGGSVNEADPNIFNLYNILDSYENGDNHLYFLLPKWRLFNQDAICEIKINKYAFLFLLMITYRLPTNCSVLECFGKKFGLLNLNNNHWIDVRSGYKTLVEFGYPLTIIYRLHKTITCTEKNIGAETIIANYALDNISNIVSNYNPNSKMFNTINKLHNNYDKLISDDKILDEFDHNINKLNNASNTLIPEYNTLRKVIESAVEITLVNELHSFIINMSRAAYNNVLVELLNYVN